MSVIVAVRKDSHIVMASDSLSVFGAHREDQTNLFNKDKILRVGSSYLGITGWMLYANIFGHYLARRKRIPRLSDE
ncbi:MAG: hypothetical protein NTW86_32070, partial [Candidatus Sumerlaeota bacterium]|nr:hypothetical protein [Candidatus Sumerlaeota bacterium]